MTRTVKILNDGQIEVTTVEEQTRVEVHTKILLLDEKTELETKIAEIDALLGDFK